MRCDGDDKDDRVIVRGRESGSRVWSAPRSFGDGVDISKVVR